MITVVGLGPGSKDMLTLGVIENLKNSNNVYLKTSKYPNAKYLESVGIKFKSYDHMYEDRNNFSIADKSIAKNLIKAYYKCNDLVYAVPENPCKGEESVKYLISLCKENNIKFQIFECINFADIIIKNFKINQHEKLEVIDALGVKREFLNKRVGIIITQVYNKSIAFYLKLTLTQNYDKNMKVYIIKGNEYGEVKSIKNIKLYELDHENNMDIFTYIYIPKVLKEKDKFQELLNIMEILRGENGCAWDRKQTHLSLKRCLIEECYEVLEAIDEENKDKIVEELGDVLLQVVFHAQIGKEAGEFNIDDVILGISKKLIERHPHVFKKRETKTEKEVLSSWDKIKKKEKGFNNYTEELEHIPKNFPALIRAEKVQKKAAKVGFDWDDVKFAMDKVIEELNEVKQVYKTQNKEKIREETGDLIFSCVNIARMLDIDPELALNYTIDKFISRFKYIEENTLKRGKTLDEISLEDMDKLWEESKTQ